jgi:hypothetical protein
MKDVVSRSGMEIKILGDLRVIACAFYQVYYTTPKIPFVIKLFLFLMTLSGICVVVLKDGSKRRMAWINVNK